MPPASAPHLTSPLHTSALPSLAHTFLRLQVRNRCSGLIRVNVYKDRVKNAGGLPSLPQQAVLQDALAGTYAELRWEGWGVLQHVRPTLVCRDS